MKKLVAIIAIFSLLFLSCKNETGKGRFTVTGELKNSPDQKVFLEQIFFSEKNPEILDTGDLKNGRFQLSTMASEEGLYRVRLAKEDSYLIFINDKPDIQLKAGTRRPEWEDIIYNTTANKDLKKLLKEISNWMIKFEEASGKSDTLSHVGSNDSLTPTQTARIKEVGESFKDFIINYITKASDPVLAMFAFGYSGGIKQAQISQLVEDLTKKFPAHQGVASFVSAYQQAIEAQNKPQPGNSNLLQVGSIAPNITMNDTNNKAFSLSQLKGKYVLIDFWASWCGPCRGENPYVVAAYHKYKNKNFTVLGVSLDEDKAKWLRAIKDDGLSWQQISDLKGWYSDAAALYGFDAIPYNVLVDPQGKIIASRLQGEALDSKLAEVLE